MTLGFEWRYLVLPVVVFCSQPYLGIAIRHVYLSVEAWMSMRSMVEYLTEGLLRRMPSAAKH